MPRPQPKAEPGPPSVIPKTACHPHDFRGVWSSAPAAVCRVRVFGEAGQTPVIVVAEHPDAPSAFVANTAELLAAEPIRNHVPGASTTSRRRSCSGMTPPSAARLLRQRPDR